MSVKDVIKNSVYEALGGGTAMTAKTVIMILVFACLAGIYIFSYINCPAKQLSTQKI